MSIGNKTEYQKNDRISFVDGLFVFAMILVVVGHCGFTQEFNVSYLHRWIYSLHMPIFFWLSGYLLNIHRDKNWVSNGYVLFLKKKFLRLLLPLFVLTTIVYYPKVLLSAFAARPAEGSFRGFIDAFLYPADNPIQPLWFLTVLFIIYAMGYWIKFFCNDSNIRLLIVLAFSFAVELVVVSLRLDLNLLDLSQVLYEMPFFIIGMMMAKSQLLKSKMFYSIKIAVILLIVLSLSVYFKSIYTISPVCSLCWRYLNAVMGVWISISFIVYFEDRGIKFIPQLRNYTFCIYLLQWFFMGLVRLAYNATHGLGLPMTFWYAVIFAAGLLVPYWLGQFVDRKMSRTGFSGYFRIIIGL